MKVELTILLWTQCSPERLPQISPFVFHPCRDIGQTDVFPLAQGVSVDDVEEGGGQGAVGHAVEGAGRLGEDLN